MKTKRKLITRAARWLVVLGIALSVTGCFVQSLHPLFTEKDLVFESALAGTWVNAKEKSTIIVEQSRDQVYKLIFNSKNEAPAEFEAHLVRLGNFLFVDTFPAPSQPEPKMNTLLAFHLLTAHNIFRIRIEGDTLRVAGLCPDKVDRTRAEVRHELTDPHGRIVLTAPTNELREFVLKHAEDAFTEVGKWHRQR